MRDATDPAATPATSLWPTTLGVAAAVSSLYLGILVWLHRPLPFADLATSGIVAVGFCLACILALILLLGLQVYSFPVVFAIGTLLVSTSAFMIYPFDGDLAFSGFLVIHDDGLSRGLPVVMLAFSALTLGASVGEARRQPLLADGPSTTWDPNAELTHKTAMILYWIFFVGFMLMSLRGPGLLTAVTSGYSGGEGFSDLRKAGELSAAMTTSINWFLPWLSVVLLATSRDERQFTRATIMAAVVCAITLLVGKRTVAIIVIALLMQIRYLRGYPLPWRRIAALGVIAWIIILTWPAVRVIPVKDWTPAVLLEAVTTRHIPGDIGEEESSRVREMLGGFAPGYQPIMVSCHYVPEVEPYRLGFDFLRSAIASFPFASRTFSNFLRMDQAPDVWMMNKIDPHFWTARAFNQIGEVYLQGGAISMIAFYLALGWYMAWAWWRLRGESDLRKVAFHSLAMFAIYKWIRLESGPVGRILLWAVILVYLVPAIYGWLIEKRGGGAAAPAPTPRLVTSSKR